MIPHNVNIEDYLHSKGERQARQKVALEVDRRSRGDLAGQEIRMRERWTVYEGRAPRHYSSNIDARGLARKCASLAVMIPWVILMFLGLVLSVTTRIR